MNISLERTTANHPAFQELVELLNATLKVTDGDDHDFYQQFNGTEDIRHVILARDGDQVVGCGAFKSYEGEVAEIKRMFVRADQRGRGVAQRMLAELEQWALDSGFKRCILETGVLQKAAIRLYTRAGYTKIPNYAQYAGLATSVCLEKKLG